jgi:hypothetical protein
MAMPHKHRIPRFSQQRIDISHGFSKNAAHWLSKAVISPFYENLINHAS